MARSSKFAHLSLEQALLWCNAMRHTKRLLVSSLAALMALPACGDIDAAGTIGDETPEPNAVYEAPFTSDVATLMDFEFDGELTSSSNSNQKGQIRAQLMFLVGHINGEPGVAHLEGATLTNITSLFTGGLYRIRYHVKLPVAWGSKTNLPTSYALTLPKRVDSTGQSSFTSKYGQVCNDGDDNSVAVSNIWYHYRPKAQGCTFTEADVTRTTAVVTKNPGNTVAKFPEYHKYWEDGALNIVAIFGKYEAGATSLDDAGIAAYNEFIAAMKAEFPTATVTPAVGANPGPGTTDITFTIVRPEGRININVFLLEAVTSTTAAWEKRYAQLTPGADLIIYGGHAGLGANIAALSKKGKFMPGKHQVFFMNGCDTFAYFDNTLPSIRAALNPDDPTGTKYMDFITNGMPAYFNSLSDDALALIRAAADEAHPLSYQQIFHNMDRDQVVVVTGEEDNVFTPGYDPGPLWNGMEKTGTVGKAQTVTYVTEVLQPGRYVFTTLPDPVNSGGDADLRVRVGAAPTITSTYKCPSYTANTNEKCVLQITAPSKVYIAVTGDATGVNSPYWLRAFQLAQ